MNLYFLRHAIAVERIDWKGSDLERPLTEKGHKKMAQEAKSLRKLGVGFNWILTSPYRRTHDTAHLIAEEFKATDRLRLSRSLAPEGDPKTLVRHLALDFRSWESLLLVGHEPFLSSLVSVLIGGNTTALSLKKGGICLLKSDSLTYDRCATLEWWLTPKLIKRLH